MNPPTHASSVLPGFDGEATSLVLASSPPRFSPLPSYAEALAATRALLDHLGMVLAAPGCVGPLPLPLEQVR